MSAQSLPPPKRRRCRRKAPPGVPWEVPVPVASDDEPSGISDKPADPKKDIKSKSADPLGLRRLKLETE